MFNFSNIDIFCCSYSFYLVLYLMFSSSVYIEAFRLKLIYLPFEGLVCGLHSLLFVSDCLIYCNAPAFRVTGHDGDLLVDNCLSYTAHHRTSHCTCGNWMFLRFIGTVCIECWCYWLVLRYSENGLTCFMLGSSLGLRYLGSFFYFSYFLEFILMFVAVVNRVPQFVCLRDLITVLGGDFGHFLIFKFLLHYRLRSFFHNENL